MNKGFIDTYQSVSFKDTSQILKTKKLDLKGFTNGVVLQVVQMIYFLL